MKKSTDISLPYVDDNTPREELDEVTSVPAPCSRTALVRDRYIDEIKSDNKKTQSWKKVDEDVWAKVVQRMRDKEKGVPRRRKDDK